MATQPISDRLVTVEEYLSTSYSPDCEFDEGVVVERNLGEIEHSFLQIVLGTIFTTHTEEWGVYGLTEQRVQISPSRFLVPDLCVLPVGVWEKVVTSPPHIVIEILSPEDTLRRAEEKAREYLRFGVQHMWVIDPYARVAYRGTAAELERVPSGELAVPGTPVKVSVSELFEQLDRMRARSEKR
ncbi:MAG: Uma2 family endonuclease [Terracidiphilus sp.]